MSLFLELNLCTSTFFLGSCIQNLPSTVWGAQVTAGKPAFIPDMEIPTFMNGQSKPLLCVSKFLFTSINQSSYLNVLTILISKGTYLRPTTSTLILAILIRQELKIALWNRHKCSRGESKFVKLYTNYWAVFFFFFFPSRKSSEFVHVLSFRCLHCSTMTQLFLFLYLGWFQNKQGSNQGKKWRGAPVPCWMKTCFNSIRSSGVIIKLFSLQMTSLQGKKKDRGRGTGSVKTLIV